MSQCKYQNIKLFTLEKAKEKSRLKKIKNPHHKITRITKAPDREEQRIKQRSDPKQFRVNRFYSTVTQFKWKLGRPEGFMQPWRL